MRECEKCVFYTDNGCSKWECKGTVTIEDYKAQIRADALSECLNIVRTNGYQVSLIMIKGLLEQLKEQTNETD